MLTDHSQQLLASAAIESLERIRLDRARAPQRLKPLLAYIEDNLFDSTLDVNQLKRSCGVRDNSVPIQFHSAVGRPPHGYIEDRRLETACRLLGDTNLKIWQISELLGYSSIQVFSRAFSRWSGQRPTQFRKKARLSQQRDNGHNGHNGTAVPRKLNDQLDKHFFFGPEALRKALGGELSHIEANALIARLLKLYPACRGLLDNRSGSMADSGDLHVAEDDVSGHSNVDESALEVRLKGTEIDRLQAEEILKELLRTPRDQHLRLVGDLRLSTSTLFLLLCDRSLTVSENDPEYGMHLARLALSSVDTLARTLSDDAVLTPLRGVGTAHLANAEIAAGKLAEAERHLMDAELHLSRGQRSAADEGDLLLFQAALRREQMRFSDAHRLLNRARELYQASGEKDRMIRLLVAQASLLCVEGTPTAAVPYLEEAATLSDGREGESHLSLLYNLLTVHTEAKNFAEAAELLPQVRQLALAYGDSYHRFRLRWIEGVVLRELGRFTDAESALLEARNAFSDSSRAVDAALVLLDLAELYARQGRFADLEGLSSSMVPLFGGLQQDREALVSLRLFQQAAEERSVTRVVLEKARQSLQKTRRQRAA